MIKLKVSKKYSNKKIVNVLLSSFSNLNQSIIFKALRKKDILVNNKRIKQNIVVKENDEIIAYIKDSFELNVIFEDDNILIVNKSIGISVTPDRYSSTCLTDIVNQTYPNALPCHRLDRNTLGLVVFAKNKKSLEILLEKFKNREIEKYYVCIVYGIPKIKNKTLIAYLFKDNKKSIVHISDTIKNNYNKIITTYSVLDFNKEKNISLLEIKLETGKTHQIRAHLAHIGYPIIGDGKYGINSINKNFKQKTQLLMSYKLKFSFKKDSGILNYLKDRTFAIKYSDFQKML